jgi:N-acetylmuramoyl-L-alanine amidase
VHRWAPRLLLIAAVLGVVGLAIAAADDDVVVPPRASQRSGPWSDVPFATGTTGALETPSGIVVPIVGVRADGSFDVQTPCDARTVVAGGSVLHGAHVVLDPGHGGDEPGAVGANGLTEKDVNLAVAQRTAELLRAAGATVVLTRPGDERVTLATRAGIAVALRPVAFVSIHHNAAADGPSTGPGTEAYFQFASPESQRLAGLLVEEVRAALTPFGGPWESDADNGAKARISSASGEDFYGVLRRTALGGVTGVLSEAGYLSNPVEADLFARDDVQQAEAQAIADALTRFLDGQQQPPAAAFSTQPPATGGGGTGSGGPEGCVDPPLE